MFRFLLARIGLLIPTFIGVTIIAFSFIRMIPGDPIEMLAGERSITPERHAALMAQFGYDQPLWQQYLNFLSGLLHGDLGRSIVTKLPVIDEFLTLFPATLELSTMAILFAMMIYDEGCFLIVDQEAPRSNRGAGTIISRIIDISTING